MKILVVSPHADDETIGLGGTIARYASEGHEITVAVMTGHGEDEAHPLWPRSTWDEIRAEAGEAYAILGVKEIIFREIPAVMVAEQPLWKLNQITSSVLNDVKPDILFVPFPFDLHKDHREIFHSFSVAWRPCSETGRNIKEIYAYEVLSETHLNFPYVEAGFIPNVWVDISLWLEKKLAAMACFRSQMRPAPDIRSVEAAKALAVWRGAQIGVRAAEAFVLTRKII